MAKKTIILFLLVLLISLDVSAQCAMCRAVLESGDSSVTAKGINDGIVYLMIFPYLLIGGIAFFIWRSRRKNKIEE